MLIGVLAIDQSRLKSVDQGGAVANPKPEFERLMERLRAGEPEAMDELCEQYVEHVHRAVRRRLTQQLRRQCDSLDLMQDVWVSFIAVPPEQFTFATPEELILFLAKMAANKIFDAFRERFQTEKRDATRELPLNEELMVARTSTASQFAMADERYEKLLAGLTPIQQQIVQLLREGHTHEEVGRRLNLQPKVIQRLINKLAERANP